MLKGVRLISLQDLTADFGVKTNAKLTQNYQLREKKIILRSVFA